MVTLRCSEADSALKCPELGHATGNDTLFSFPRHHLAARPRRFVVPTISAPCSSSHPKTLSAQAVPLAPAISCEAFSHPVSQLIPTRQVPACRLGREVHTNPFLSSLLTTLYYIACKSHSYTKCTVSLRSIALSKPRSITHFVFLQANARISGETVVANDEKGALSVRSCNN